MANTKKNNKAKPKGKGAAAKKRSVSLPRSEATKRRIKRKKENRRRTRLPNRRSILRGAKSAWIFFCEAHRDEILEHHPGISFGNVCRQLGPRWRALSQEEKQPYVEKHRIDQARYERDKAALTDDQHKTLRKIKKQKRCKRKDAPAAALSPYMFYVKTVRPQIVAANPNADFMEIGRLLGSKWNQLTAAERQPYEEQGQQDKLRYAKEMADHKAKIEAEKTAKKSTK